MEFYIQVKISEQQKWLKIIFTLLKLNCEVKFIPDFQRE